MTKKQFCRGMWKGLSTKPAGKFYQENCSLQKEIVGYNFEKETERAIVKLFVFSKINVDRLDVTVLVYMSCRQHAL